MRRRCVLLVALLSALAPAVAAGAPSLAAGTLSPTSWSPAASVAATWMQRDFDGQGLGPARVEVNLASDGSESGAWETRLTSPAPLASGANGTLALPVDDLEGRHQVRVVVDGAADSPLPLGTLRLDRGLPAVALSGVSRAGDAALVPWTEADRGPAGLDPDADPRVEVNASPAGDAAGASVRTPGRLPSAEGAQSWRVERADLSEGVQRTRVLVTDRAGNGAEQPLGVVVADRRPPEVTARVVRPPTVDDPSVEIEVAATDPMPGSGIADDAVAEIGTPRSAYFYARGVAPGGSGRLTVRLPGGGIHQLAVRVADRAGRVGESAELTVRVPVRPRSAPRDPRRRPVVPVDLPRPRAGERAGPGVREAYAAARRLHARRGLRLRGPVSAARDAATWRRLLGDADAHRYMGYATFAGRVLVGPEGTAALERLRRLREAPTGPSGAQADRMVTALAVLLHETLHATGPVVPEDVRLTPSGRAFEEGFTEAATVDLLQAYVREVGGPPALRRGLLAAARRYRPAYPAQVGWARRMSGLATRGPGSGPAARAFRVTVADRWGADRWTRLSVAIGRGELDLRQSAGDPSPPARRR